MYLAALDTSAARGSFAILREDASVVAAVNELETGRRSAGLFSAVMSCCEQAGFHPNDIRAWRVGMGPGSFTGIRAGAALVLGIAYGSGATVRGAPSASALLQAAALPAQTDRAFGLFDGRRGETLVSPCVRQDTGWALAEPPYAKKISELDPTATYVVLEQDPIVADVQASVGDSAIIVDHLAVQAFWGTDAQRLDGEDELVPLYVRPSVFVRPKTPRFQRASA